MSAAAGFAGIGGGRELITKADSEAARARIELATPRVSVKEQEAMIWACLQGLS
jgi:hypothetical protein